MLCIFIKIRFSKNKLTLNPPLPCFQHKPCCVPSRTKPGIQVGVILDYRHILLEKKKKSDICFVRLIAV